MSIPSLNRINQNYFKFESLAALIRHTNVFAPKSLEYHFSFSTVDVYHRNVAFTSLSWLPMILVTSSEQQVMAISSSSQSTLTLQLQTPIVGKEERQNTRGTHQSLTQPSNLEKKPHGSEEHKDVGVGIQIRFGSIQISNFQGLKISASFWYL